MSQKQQAQTQDPAVPAAVSTSGMPQFTPEQVAALDALNAEGVEAERQFNIHPIVRQVVHILQKPDGTGWVDAITKEEEDQIYLALDEAKLANSIHKAVFDLFRLCAHLHDTLKQLRLSVDLYLLFNNAVVRYNLLATMDLAAGTSKDAATDKHHEAVGSRELAMPAKVGDKPPEGTVKFDKFAARRRI
jgi:hypothetical protein